MWRATKIKGGVEPLLWDKLGVMYACSNAAASGANFVEHMICL
jgi:hypothetical protein